MKIFLRSLILSLTVIICIFILTVGSAKAYEGIKATENAEYKKAFEINDKTFRIFDYEFKKTALNFLF